MASGGPTSTAGLLKRLDPRAGPLIITVFGDAIAPRGGNIWLGSLIGLMANFGLSERLVRTAVFRLARDGWLAARSKGRRSYYDLTPDSRKTFAEADQRIYAASPPDWDGNWTLVQALPDQSVSERQKWRRSLKWRGFGQLSPTLMVSAQTHDASQIETAGQSLPAVFTARLQTGSEHTANLTTTAAAAWNIEELSAAYMAFVNRFRPFASELPDDPAQQFTIRTLLIHEYRRILLKDPQLSSQMLPDSWAGETARTLTAAIYKSLAGTTDDFITANIECWSSTCPQPDAESRKRFAGAD